MFEDLDFNKEHEYNKLKDDFVNLVKQLNIAPGTLLKTKNSFYSWLDNPLTFQDFNRGTIFVVLKVLYVNDEDEITLHCLQDNKVIIFDTFMFFLNQYELSDFDEVFNHYFEICGIK